MKALYVGEAVAVVGLAAGTAAGAAWAADWLAAALWHPVAAAPAAGVALRLSRGRHPLWVLQRWHGTAVQRLEGED